MSGTGDRPRCDRPAARRAARPATGAAHPMPRWRTCWTPPGFPVRQRWRRHGDRRAQSRLRNVERRAARCGTSQGARSFRRAAAKQSRDRAGKRRGPHAQRRSRPARPWSRRHQQIVANKGKGDEQAKAQPLLPPAALPSPPQRHATPPRSLPHVLCRSLEDERRRPYGATSRISINPPPPSVSTLLLVVWWLMWQCNSHLPGSRASQSTS
jgi:hypothetical protein